jgi:restriction endonuclease S subunit
MEGFQLGVPPAKAEQEAIAEALSDADALIESLEQLIAKKRHIKQGAMQELLTGRKRLAEFSGMWEEKPLGHVIDALEAGVSVNSVEDDRRQLVAKVSLKPQLYGMVGFFRTKPKGLLHEMFAELVLLPVAIQSLLAA